MNSPPVHEPCPATVAATTTTPPTPLCELRVADSVFLGYVSTHTTLPSIELFRQNLIDVHHPQAAHVPYAASLAASEISEGDKSDKEGYDDDDEPTGSHVGATLLKELNWYKKGLRRQSTVRIRGGSAAIIDSDGDDSESCGYDGNANGECRVATAIIVVRYFEKRLLGVTCGRLRGVYQRTARLALHRHLMGRDLPFVERYYFGKGGNCTKNLFGLGAGDTELILDVVPLGDMGESAEGMTASSRLNSGVDNVQKLLAELKFETMVGSRNEPLPRLQNLQADLPIVGSVCDNHRNNVLVPVYRYPGNYSGLEWPTHAWSRTTLSIKRAVEEALRPLYIQRMNHCVANLYRDGGDRIDRHSDKDLDLNREGVIVSVSLGAARVMELRDRTFPHDMARVELPEGSMFVLGPYTNDRFTHAVLPLEEDEQVRDEMVRFCKGVEVGNDAECSVEGGGRISLTFRDVRTFLDVKTQRLFGQGVSSSSGTPILSEDGAITNASLARAVQSTRDTDRRDRTGTLLVSIGIGAAAACAISESSDRKGGGSTKRDMLRLLCGISTAAISASASYWYLQRLRSKIRHLREEKEARFIFSKKSASGNKY